MIDIGILRSLVASREQQHNLRTCNGVIDAIAWPNVDAHLPHAVAAKLVIAKVAQLRPVDSAVDSNPCLCVAELTTPLHEDVFTRPGSGNGESRTYLNYRF
jgi:hypothetical protein